MKNANLETSTVKMSGLEDTGCGSGDELIKSESLMAIFLTTYILQVVSVYNNVWSFSLIKDSPISL